jgi:hypothetical protein
VALDQEASTQVRPDQELLTQAAPTQAPDTQVRPTCRSYGTGDIWEGSQPINPADLKGERSGDI